MGRTERRAADRARVTFRPRWAICFGHPIGQPLPNYRSLCGEGGIRTLGTVARTHDFQSCTFDHSVTSPPHGDRASDAGGAEVRLLAANLSHRSPAERVGFEPTVPLRVRLISNQVPSATRSSLQSRMFPSLARRRPVLSSP